MEMLIPGVYGVVALTYIAFKLLSSTQYEPSESIYEPSVSVIIPEYNEDPELFERGIQSLLEQSYPLAELWIVDDGSIDTRAWEVAKRYSETYNLIRCHRLEQNRGKRHAQSYAFERAIGEVFVTMDSDTLVEPDAIKNLVKPLAAAEVNAVTGYPQIINRNSNLLTRLIDMRYWVAFNVERASRSIFGVVICCCGVLSAYRREVVLENLNEYKNQEFLGAKCNFGDDRHLTSLCLQDGDVRYQRTARAKTSAPESLIPYLRQQVRWMRSFWRETALALSWAPKRSFALTGFLTMDLTLPFLLVTFGFGSALYRWTMFGSGQIALYVAIIGGIAYLRNLPYSKRDMGVFLLSPLYTILYLVVLLPLSFYALVTIRRWEWTTREVDAADIDDEEKDPTAASLEIDSNLTASD